MSPSWPRWRKSSFSGDNSECIEVLGTLDQLRDSKNLAGPTLRGDVRRFASAIQAGHLTR